MRIVCKMLRKFLPAVRRIFYRTISNANVKGCPLCAAPFLAEGEGSVVFGKDVHVGISNDTDFWNSYIFLNPRCKNCRIEIGDSSWIGNHFVAISEGPGIFIGKNVLVGTRVEIYDTDFHAVDVQDRLVSEAKQAQVKIGNGVWIGNNVTILKGTEVGEHSVIAAGAVCCGKYPANSVIGGVPAKVLRAIEFREKA